MSDPKTPQTPAAQSPKPTRPVPKFEQEIGGEDINEAGIPIEEMSRTWSGARPVPETKRD